MSANIIIQNSKNGVITLKEITDLITVEHNKAMKVVDRLCLEISFGTVEKIATVYNDKNQTIDTYLLTKKQAIAVGAKLNNSLLMKVIDRLEELENQNKPKTTLDLIIQSAQEMQFIKEVQDNQGKRIEILEDSKVITARQRHSLKRAVTSKVYEIKNNHNMGDDFIKKGFQRIWKKLKDRYLISSYLDIPSIKFDESLVIVNSISIGDLL